METINQEDYKRNLEIYKRARRKEKMKEKAIQQMKMSRFKDELVQEFERNNIIYITSLGNGLLKANEIEMKSVKILEEKHKDIIIYHIEKRKTDNRLFYHYFHINSKYQNRVITEVRYLWEKEN